MTREDHFRKLENMYHRRAPCNDYYQPRLTIGEGTAEVVIPVKDAFFHAAGAVHGSVYFKILDDAAFFSVNSLVEDVFVLTANFNIYLTRPVSTGKMRAIGRVVTATRRLWVAEAVAYDDRQREIARGSGSFMKSNIALGENLGYG